MRGLKKTRGTRVQWKDALLEVVASQGEESLRKGEIISRTAVMMGYTPSHMNSMALAAFLELEHEGKIEEFHLEGSGTIKRCRLAESKDQDAKRAEFSASAPESSADSIVGEDVSAQDRSDFRAFFAQTSARLERKIDHLSQQVAVLSELLNAQKHEFEARQAGVLSMLEEEARRRRENGAHGNSNEAVVPMSRRNG
ncbi:MAG: hypothetical protein HYT41_02155 [Candidatus Sungbacteria bacterium]|nr:hypothetical protein [Candidatus Sungbacteria bacterium]